MIDLNRIHHTGMIVEDIDAAQASLGQSMGLQWAPVRDFSPFPFWTPEQGLHEVNVKATYSIGAPHHFELVQGTGPFYDPHSAPDGRHIGVWTDDLPGEVERLLSAGWHIVAAGAAPEDGYGPICYIAPPMPGLLVELISTVLKPIIDEWLGE